MRLLSRNVELVKLIMERVIQENDLCIDATLGNGNDALYMYKLGGRVIGFDIQDEAIKNSKSKFREELQDEMDNENLNKVMLVKDSHENIEKYLTTEDKEYNRIKFATFNLGYLPKGNKAIITKADATIKALDTCIKYLAPDGVISIVVYYEHDGGIEEKMAVEEYLKFLNEENVEVVCINKYNSTKSLPITYFIYKK